MMTNQQIAELLKELGFDIKYRKRKDGGILITKINGASYTGAQGNEQARNLAQSLGIKNATISAKRIKQLKTIKPKKGTFGRKLEAVPEDVKKQIKELQKKYRKTSNKSKRDAGSVGIRNYRYMKAKYGEREARDYLDRAERYIEDRAYDENIYAIIQRIKADGDGMEASLRDKMYKVADKLEEVMRNGYIKTEALNRIVFILYEMESSWNTARTAQEQGALVNTFTNQALTIIRIGFINK